MTGYLPIVILTIVLFALLAAVLLVPVYRFLKKEEEASKNWTRESLEARARARKAERHGPDGRPPRGTTPHSGDDATR